MHLLGLSLAVAALFSAAVSAQPAAPSSTPVNASEESVKKHWQSLRIGMSFDQVTEVMGKPSRIDDLQKGFFGLSPVEDGFMMQNRPRLERRAVWYLKKAETSPNLNDVWFSAYFSKADGTLVGKLSNPPDRR